MRGTVEDRIVGERGCGFPIPGGCYAESIGSEGGILPDIVVFDDPIPYDEKWHRGFVYIDLEALIAGAGVQRTGASLERLEDTRLRQVADRVMCAAFGESVIVRPGHALALIDQLARILESNGLAPGTLLASSSRIQPILQAHLQELLPHIDFK